VKWTDYDISYLYEWAENGMPMTAPAEFINYVNMLTRIYNMRMRFDKFGEKEAIINHLVVFEPEIKGNRLVALRLFNESMEYFYGSQELTKNAFRNRYADDLEKDYTLARKLAQNVADLEKASKILERAAKIRQLDVEDKEEITNEMMNKPFKVYTFDTSHFEIGNEDPEKTAAFIEVKLEQMSPKAIERIKEEALLSLPVRVFQEDTENPRKDK